MALPTIPDYVNSIKVPRLVCAPMLAGGRHEEKNRQVIKYSGGFCVVFPYVTPSKKYAVRCWHAEVEDAKERIQKISAALKKSSLPYFVGFEYVNDGILTPMGKQPIVLMDWVDAKPIKKYIALHITNKSKLEALAANFLKMVSDLHKENFSHGDLQHGNIMVRDDGSLILVDYDSMFVPGLEGKDDDIKGLEGYQCEARWKNKKISPKSDYFSELVIYTTIKALTVNPKYWDELNMPNTDTMLFSGEDIKSKGSSSIFQSLRNENNKELTDMVDHLCKFMQCSSLDEILPLENAIVSMSDTISSKWGPGTRQVPAKPSIAKGEVKVNIDQISSMWNKK